MVEIPILGWAGKALPMIFLGGGELSLLGAAYIRNLHLLGVKPASLWKRARAIGLLYDYYVIEKGGPVLDEFSLKELFKLFYEARRYGCVGLGWQPVRLGAAKNDLRFVSEFSTFCSENFGHKDANPLERRLIEQQTGAEFQAWVSKVKARREQDMLVHLYGSTQAARGVVFGREHEPDAGKSNKGVVAKYFPPQEVLRFIEATPSLRDRLCWMLLFFAGLRISELVHLYVRDIAYDKRTGTAKIILADPEDATIEWKDDSGQSRRTTRAAFLLEKYGRVPRNRLALKHPEHAGWKGMVYEDARRCESEVYWIDNRVGELFWKTHQKYMLTERLAVGDRHPYYFITLYADKSYGLPLKLKNLHNQFYRNALRIGLSASSDGVNPHGARHFYGYYSASWLKMSLERVKTMMHHAKPSSTNIYYALDKSVVRDELEKAQEKMTAQIPFFIKKLKFGELEVNE